MNYAIVFEKTKTGYSAYAPDLPGYGAAAKTLEELRALVREGIPFHIDGLRRVGKPIPPAETIVETIDVA